MVRNRLKRTVRAAFEEIGDTRRGGLDYVVLARRDLVELVEREGMSGVQRALAELIAESGEPITNGSDEDTEPGK